jgi:hypothetical protein
MSDKTKPPAHLVEAWVQRVRNLMKAQSIRAKATIMFDSGDAVLRVRAEYYRNLATRLERVADSQFNNAIRLECKQRCFVNRYSSRCKGAWEVDTWQPYRQEEAVLWLFTPSMKLPTKNPRTFESVLARATRKASSSRGGK